MSWFCFQHMYKSVYTPAYVQVIDESPSMCTSHWWIPNILYKLVDDFPVYCTSQLMISQCIVQVCWWFPTICTSCWWFLSHVQVICDCSVCVQVGKWFPSMCTSCWWFPSIIVQVGWRFFYIFTSQLIYFPVDIISFEKIVFYILVNVLLMYDRYLFITSFGLKVNIFIHWDDVLLLVLLNFQLIFLQMKRDAIS